MPAKSPEPFGSSAAMPTATLLAADDAEFDLETITAAIDSGQPLTRILDIVVARAAVLLGAVETVVLLREGEGLVCAAQRGLPEESTGQNQIPLHEGVEGWVAARRRPLVLTDLHHDPRFPDLPQRHRQIASLIALPLLARGTVLGVLTAASAEQTDFSQDLTLLLVLADLATLAIESSQGHARELRRARLIDLLRFVSHRDYEADLPTAIQPVADRIAEVMGAEKVDLIFLDREREAFVSLGVSNTPLGRRQQELGLDVVPAAADSLIKDVFERGEAVLVTDAPRDPRVYRPFAEQLGIRSLLYCPLAVGGERRGIASCASTRSDAFDVEDLEVLDLIARRLSLALQHLELSEDLSRLEADRLARMQRDDLLELLVHDLKNPLAVLKGYAQLAARRLARGDNAYVESALDNMNERIDQVNGMVNDMLDMTRMVAGTFRIRRREIDLAALVRAEVEATQTTSAAHSLTFTGPDELRLAGDPIRLTEVVQNLLTNAIQYSPAGGTIGVALQQRAGFAEVAVCDQGMGIPPDEIDHVFERAYRGQGEQVARGQGLGLYISREIARLHGGDIDVQSTPGQGSCFYVRLPLTPPA